MTPSTSASPARTGGETLVAVDVAWDAPDGSPILGATSLALGREKTGLIGRNGIGKSTLARILVGDLAPTRGHVIRSGRVAWLPQRLEPAPGASLADGLGIGGILAAIARIEAGSVSPADFDAVGDRWDAAEQAAAQLDRLGLGHLDLGRPMDSLSGGERTRIALAARMLSSPDLLILDEPTNNLDAPSRALLRQALCQWGGGALVISHDRELLEGMDQLIELTDQGATVYGGGYSFYEEQRAVMDAARAQDVRDAARELSRQQRDLQLARERQAKRNSRGREKARREGVPRILLGAMKQRAETSTARLNDVHGDRLAQATQALDSAKRRIRQANEIKIDLSGTSVPSGREVLRMEALRFSWPGGAPLLGDGLSLTLRGPERLAVVGPNGAGKTTLIRLILGELAPTSGALHVGASPVAWLDQHTRILDPRRSVLDTFRALNPGLEEGLCRWRLARFLLAKETPHRLPHQLSGGERVRAAMACVLGGMSPPQLLILDEPTNDLDLDTVEQVESALGAYRGALILISHDAAFLDRVGIDRQLRLPPRAERAAP